MNWVKRFREEGLDGLKDQPGRGSKPYLPEKERIAFKQAVLWFQDEARVGQRGTVTRTWAAKGTRPRLIRQQ
jgi:transposase